MAFDLLIVTYDQDLHFLEMQARSIDYYFDYEDINQIIIVHNNLNGSLVPINLELYGKFKSKINQLNFDDFKFIEDKVDYLDPLYGWRRQQFCKLFVAGQCTVDWCFVVDSKTIFLYKYNQKEFFAPDGRCITVYRRNDPYFVKSNNWLERFFDLTPSDHYALLPRRGTPIFLHTPTIRSVLSDVFWRTKTGFFNWFIDLQKRIGISEFDLYFTYIRYKNNLPDMYVITNNSVKNLIMLTVSKESISFPEEMTRLENNYYFSVSAHQKLLDSLPKEQFNQFYHYLTVKKLFLNG